jgi:hypothetical protein
VPIGIAVAKVHKFGKLPIKISLGVQWMAVQPDRFGQKWNVQLQVIPVLRSSSREISPPPRA